MIDKIDLKETLDRLFAFYEGRMTEGILAEINVRSETSADPRQAARVRPCLAREHPELCVQAMHRTVESMRRSRSDARRDPGLSLA